MKLVSRREGRLFGVTGASRSGKSLWTAQQLAPARRLLVWDYPKGEWSMRHRCRRVSDFAELAAICAPGSRAERIAFLRVDGDPRDSFETFARLAWIYIRAHGAPLVAEELSSVTQPGKAPLAWGNIIRMGLGYGSDIYALTQRPAESDSTAFGNASVLHVGRCGSARDRMTMADYLDVPRDQVGRLKPLEFIERHADGRLIVGRVNTNKRT